MWRKLRAAIRVRIAEIHRGERSAGRFLDDLRRIDPDLDLSHQPGWRRILFGVFAVVVALAMVAVHSAVWVRTQNLELEARTSRAEMRVSAGSRSSYPAWMTWAVIAILAASAVWFAAGLSVELDPWRVAGRAFAALWLACSVTLVIAAILWSQEERRLRHRLHMALPGWYRRRVLIRIALYVRCWVVDSGDMVFVHAGLLALAVGGGLIFGYQFAWSFSGLAFVIIVLAAFHDWFWPPNVLLIAASDVASVESEAQMYGSHWLRVIHLLQRRAEVDWLKRPHSCRLSLERDDCDEEAVWMAKVERLARAVEVIWVDDRSGSGRVRNEVDILERCRLADRAVFVRSFLLPGGGVDWPRAVARAAEVRRIVRAERGYALEDLG